jgi:pimeloyl-ACP methyl ester carboxylesterase
MDQQGEIRHEFIHAGGLRFHVASCGEGDRLALCLHGFPENWYSWRHQMPLLAKLGYRVWAPDLRGYGESDRPRGIQAYAIEALMEDVAAMIDASGARSTLLLGHDWGAAIAWLFAIRQIRDLEALVIMNVPHPACFAEAARRSLRQLGRSWYIFFFQLPWLPEKLLAARPVGELIARTSVNRQRFGPEVQRVYNENASRPGALTAMINPRGAHRHDQLLPGHAAGGGGKRQSRLGFPVIDTPTLMIWGERDVALGVETTHGTDRYVSDLTLRMLPGVSHWVQQDDPEQVNEILAGWLSSRREG